MTPDTNDDAIEPEVADHTGLPVPPLADPPARRTLPSVPLSTRQVRKITPLVLAGIFVWRVVRGRRPRA